MKTNERKEIVWGRNKKYLWNKKNKPVEKNVRDKWRKIKRKERKKNKERKAEYEEKQGRRENKRN